VRRAGERKLVDHDQPVAVVEQVQLHLVQAEPELGLDEDLLAEVVFQFRDLPTFPVRQVERDVRADG
jgi:hypothetical protein